VWNALLVERRRQIKAAKTDAFAERDARPHRYTAYGHGMKRRPRAVSVVLEVRTGKWWRWRGGRGFGRFRESGSGHQTNNGGENTKHFSDRAH